MTENFWQEFYRTGRVEDYLNYRSTMSGGERERDKASWRKLKQKELL